LAMPSRCLSIFELSVGRDAAWYWSLQQDQL